MDVPVRFWDPKKNYITTRYFGSAFLGHSTADDLLDKLLQSTKDVFFDYNKILQVSIPSVNWKLFLTLCVVNWGADDPSAAGPLSEGSCGLHTVQNAFKDNAVASNFHVSDLLLSLRWLMIDSPARRADYQEVTKRTFIN